MLLSELEVDKRLYFAGFNLDDDSHESYKYDNVKENRHFYERFAASLRESVGKEMEDVAECYQHKYVPIVVDDIKQEFGVEAGEDL